MLWLLSGSPVCFLLLQYSVLCTVESLPLLYLLFISCFMFSGGGGWGVCVWGGGGGGRGNYPYMT